MESANPTPPLDPKVKQKVLRLLVAAGSRVFADYDIPNKLAERVLEVIESTIYHVTGTKSRFCYSTVGALLNDIERYGYGIPNPNPNPGS